jgi:hypothetical protein
MRLNRPNRRFKFNKRRQLFIRPHNVTLPIAANARQQSRSFARWNPTVDRNRARSRLLFLTEFLEARIVPERIEHWIEPEQRRSEGHVGSH